MSRLSRRRLLAGSVALLLGACRRTEANSPRAIEPGTQPALPTPFSFRPTVPARTPTPTPTPTPRAAPNATPAPPEEQFLLRGTFFADPLSHDFNANIDCGGDATLWAGLLAVDQQYNLVADWAASWESNADASQWTFHLRPNTGWSDGKPVTAADFVWSWRRALDPATHAPHAWVFFDVVNAAEINRGQLPPDKLGVAALDDLTLRVSLTGPRIYFPAIAASLAAVPAYRPAVEQHGEKWTEAANIVTNGPFKLQAWEHGKQLSTVRSPSYWNAAAISLRRTLAPILSPEQHLAPYRTNQVDFLPVQAADLAELRGDDSLVAEVHPAVLPATWLLLPSSVPPAGDPLVRQALGHALDRKRLVEVTMGQVIRASSLLPPGFPGASDDPGLEALQAFDVDAALAARAKTPFAAGDWPPLRLAIEQDDTLAGALGQDVAAQLRENLGMALTVVPLEAGKLAGAPPPDIHLRLLRWGFLYPDPNNGYADALFPPGDETTRLDPEPAGVRALVAQARGERDPSARTALYLEIERRLQQSFAYLPLAHPVQYLLVHAWVQRFPARGGFLIPPSRLFTRLVTLLSIAGRPHG